MSKREVRDNDDSDDDFGPMPVAAGSSDDQKLTKKRTRDLQFEKVSKNLYNLFYY